CYSLALHSFPTRRSSDLFGGLGNAVSLELLVLGQLRQRGLQRIHFFGDAAIGFETGLIGGLAAGKVLVLGGAVGLHKLVGQGLHVSTAVDHMNTSSNSPKSYFITACFDPSAGGSGEEERVAMASSELQCSPGSRARPCGPAMK